MNTPSLPLPFMLVFISYFVKLATKGKFQKNRYVIRITSKVSLFTVKQQELGLILYEENIKI